MNVFKSIIKSNLRILLKMAMQENFKIAELSSNEIENISGGVLHIRKLPQIINSPDV